MGLGFMLGLSVFGSVGLIIAALAYGAYQLYKVAKTDTKQDDQPTSTATRGTIAPRVIGRQKVGAIVGWVQSQPDTGQGLIGQPLGQDPQGGKGAGGGDASENKFESGMHILAVGPIIALHNIRENGKIIWEGPITPYTHPSGTSVVITASGGPALFRIYWGDKDYANVDPTLLAATQFGNNVWMSKFSLYCFVVWNAMSLGPSRRWPQLEYEVEGPVYSSLAKSSPNILSVDSELPVMVSYPTGTNIGQLMQVHLGKRAGYMVDEIIYLSGTPGDISQGIKLKVRNALAYVQFLNPNPPVIYDTKLGHGVDVTDKFPPGTIVKLAGALPSYYAQAGNTLISKQLLSDIDPAGGTTGSPRYYVVSRSEWFSSELASLWPGYPWGTGGSPDPPIGQNYIYLEPLLKNPHEVFNDDPNYVSGLVGKDSNNQFPYANWLEISPCSAGLAGVNPAHLIDDLMFSKWPYGAGLDRSEFNQESLEDAGLLFEREKIRLNVMLTDGAPYQDAMKQVLEVASFGIAWDIKTGTYLFVPNREPDSVPVIPDEAIMPSAPEIETGHDFKNVQRQVWVFQDRQINYREMTFELRDDGQASYLEYHNAKRIDLPFVTDYPTAERVARRRSAESFAKPASISLSVNRDAGDIYPGAVFKTSHHPMTLKCVSVKNDVLSSKTTVRALVDTFGVPEYGKEEDGGDYGLIGPPTRPPKLELTEAFSSSDIVEVPKLLGALIGNPLKPKALIPRTRIQIAGIARLHLSRDNSTYNYVLDSTAIYTGGRLKNELPASTPLLMDDDASLYYSMPDCNEFGIDILMVENLTGNEAAWLAGRQLLLLTDGVNTEVCLLRNIVVGLSNDYKLSGLVRARYGTKRLTWPAGTQFYIFRSHAVDYIESPVLVPGKQAYSKAQPISAAGALTLSVVQPKSMTVQGLALRPLDTANFGTADGSQAYETGDDIVLTWQYGSIEKIRTAAGMQVYGEVMSPSKPEGQFEITITDDVNTFVVTLNDTNTYTLSAAIRSANLSETNPDSITLTLVNRLNGYSSTPEEITINKV